MQRLFYFLLPLLLACCLAGCTGAPATPSPSAPQKPEAGITRVVGYEDDLSDYIAGNVVESMLAMPRYTGNIDGETVSVILYVDAEVDDMGDIAWNDGQLQTLLVRRGEGGYPLIAKTYIQGSLGCTVIESHDDGSLTILATYKASAGITIWEYTYEADTDSFVERTIYDTTGNVSVYG